MCEPHHKIHKEVKERLDFKLIIAISFKDFFIKKPFLFIQS